MRGLKGTIIATAVLLFATGAPLSSAADLGSMDVELRHIELEWARIKYRVKDTGTQERQLRALADETAKVADLYPGHAEPLIWQGVIASSEASVAGAFSALGFAKQARELFEKAGRLDFRALDGAVPTSLGALYYMVPGFPLGFGDDEKARHYLEQGIEISPTGLDANYFYGDFLYRDRQYRKAKEFLERALNTTPDLERTIWDTGRRQEIRSLLARVDGKLGIGQ